MSENELKDNELLEIGKIVNNALKSKNALQIYSHRKNLIISCKFNQQRTHRYILAAVHNKAMDNRIATVIMHNPSYANENIADKSVNFIEQFILENKSKLGVFSKLNIVNLFSEIETTEFKPDCTSTNKENDKTIDDAIEESEIIIIAWGAENNAAKKKRAEEIVNSIKRHQKKNVYRCAKHPSVGTLKPEFIEPVSL